MTAIIKDELYSWIATISTIAIAVFIGWRVLNEIQRNVQADVDVGAPPQFSFWGSVFLFVSAVVLIAITQVFLYDKGEIKTEEETSD